MLFFAKEKVPFPPVENIGKNDLALTRRNVLIMAVQTAEQDILSAIRMGLIRLYLKSNYRLNIH